MPGSNNYSQRPEEDQQKVIPTGQSGGPTPPLPTVQEQPVSNNQELINVLERQLAENPLETPEQRKRRERREKWEGIISGISDAASAVSNLIFTTKGAPNMYNHVNSMSKAAQARFDKAKAERDEKLNNYLQYAMNLGKLKDAQAQRAHDNALADAKEERAVALFLLKKDLEQNRVDGAKADARRKKAEAGYAEKYQKARVKREKASAGASNARADYYRGGGSGGKKSEFPWYDKDGKLHYAQSYEAAAYNARANGTWNEEETTSTSERDDGFTTTTTTSTKPGKGYSKRPEKKGKGYGSESGKGKGY